MKKILQKLFAANLYMQIKDEHGKAKITLVHKKSFHSVSDKVATNVIDKVFDKLIDKMIERFEVRNAPKPAVVIPMVPTTLQLQSKKKSPIKKRVIKEVKKRLLSKDKEVKAAPVVKAPAVKKKIVAKSTAKKSTKTKGTKGKK